MKSYPSIDGVSCSYLNELIGQDCIVFEKPDGSNLRFSWSKKTGWNKFGTRNRLFDETDKEYGKAIKIFKSNFAEKLTEKLKSNFKGIEKAIVFCEFHAPSSFAGHHDFNEEFTLSLFDVEVYKKGYVDPFSFETIFGDLNITKVLYKGKLTLELIENIKNGYFGEGEGVVIKGLYKDKKQHHNIWRVKVKTKFWLNKLKESNYKQILEENEREQKI